MSGQLAGDAAVTALGLEDRSIVLMGLLGWFGNGSVPVAAREEFELALKHVLAAEKASRPLSRQVSA